MRRLTPVLLAVVIVGSFALLGCDRSPQAEVDKVYEDGTYRGAFLDRDEMQVNIQFTLENHTISDISYRLLQYRGVDYLEDTDPAVEAIREQHMQVLEYLQGTDIRETLTSLYEPGNLVDDIDGYAGATMRASKIISAVRDALNRGVYAF